MTAVARHLITSALAASAIVVSLGAAAQRTASSEDMSPYLPPGAGRELVLPACGGCHELTGTLRLRQSETAWETMILDMGARGAPIAIDDVTPLAKYLASAFGPKAPPLTDVSAATREELLKLPGMTDAAADRLIAERAKATLTSHDQVRTAIGLDAQAFEKIKYYLYVKPVRR